MIEEPATPHPTKNSGLRYQSALSCLHALKWQSPVQEPESRVFRIPHTTSPVPVSMRQE